MLPEPIPHPLLTCGTCYGSGEASGRDCTSCSIRAPRCPSCDHLAVFHGPEGCRHAVTVAMPGANVVCPCAAAFTPPSKDADPPPDSPEHIDRARWMQGGLASRGIRRPGSDGVAT